MRIFYLLYSLLTLIILTAAPRTQTAYAYESYFTYRETRADTIQMFPKWMDMMARYKLDSNRLQSVCGSDQLSPCRLKSWKDFIIAQRGKPLSTQLNEVNRFINAYPYIEDIVNWGIEDYWETPYQFQTHNGDCEDFSMAKYVSLRALGVSDDQMRLTIVRDLNLGGIIHAVLMVNLNGTQVILDNQIKQVMPALEIYHYVPIYAINEQHWWQFFAP